MKNLKYILMVLLSGAMYGTMSSFVKLSYAEGFKAAELSFAQALLAALFSRKYKRLFGAPPRRDVQRQIAV